MRRVLTWAGESGIGTGCFSKIPSGSFVNTVCHFLASKRSKISNFRPENDPKPSTWPSGPKRANRFFLRFTALVQSSKMTPRGTSPMYFQFLNAGAFLVQPLPWKFDSRIYRPASRGALQNCAGKSSAKIQHGEPRVQRVRRVWASAERVLPLPAAPCGPGEDIPVQAMPPGHERCG